MSPATTTAGSSAAAAEAAESEAAVPLAVPPCPACGAGYLLPFSAMAFWACSTPSCTYMLSTVSTGATLYKGHGSTEMKERGGKRWVEFNF